MAMGRPHIDHPTSRQEGQSANLVANAKSAFPCLLDQVKQYTTEGLGRSREGLKEAASLKRLREVKIERTHRLANLAANAKAALAFHLDQVKQYTTEGLKRSREGPKEAAYHRESNDIKIDLSKEFLVLKMVDLIYVPGVDSHQLRMKVFPLSSVDDAKEWWISDEDEKITTWEELVEKILLNDRWIDTDSFTEDANASDHQDTTSDVFDGSIIKHAESSMSSNFIYTSPVGGPINKSRAHPREIMTEVLKALQELNVCWKKMGHYNMKCRWDPGSNGMQSNNYFGDELSIVEAETTSQSYNVVHQFLNSCAKIIKMMAFLSVEHMNKSKVEKLDHNRQPIWKVRVMSLRNFLFNLGLSPGVMNEMQVGHLLCFVLKVNIHENVCWKELGLLVFVWIAFLRLQIVKVPIDAEAQGPYKLHFSTCSFRTDCVLMRQKLRDANLDNYMASFSLKLLTSGHVKQVGMGSCAYVTRNGIQQRLNSWQDDVTRTNCAIQPDTNWTYIFVVKEQIGTFTYFPSINYQKLAGWFDPIRVNNRVVISVPFPKPEAEFDLLISDWYFTDYKVDLDILYQLIKDDESEE
ncbi:monocopper oxidase-like protein SKU5 [Tanacetum coccineum]|uniref:Monocopper oxidase-like protein SKU5 n=1 Tax=Tanacetum coccineum TaxID=301880 RepID=A0ABQ4Z827_9ASTR